MKLSVEAFDYSHAIDCCKNGIDVVIVGDLTFATRLSFSISDEQLINLIKNKNKSEIWVKVNAIFFEQDLEKLTSYLKWLKEINVDRIIFQDLAVSQINDEQNLGLNLHYCPETLVTNYGQFALYQKAGFKSVFLSRELSLTEIKEITDHKENLEIEIQGHGYCFVMHSRWKMIQNFVDYYDLQKEEINHEDLLIREELRKYNNILFEDIHGTHMLTGYMIYTIDLINKLTQANIDYLRLDFLKTNLTYARAITNLYQNALNKEFNDQLLDEFKQLNKDFILTHNFLGGLNEIYGLKKKEG